VLESGIGEGVFMIWLLSGCGQSTEDSKLM